jgi:hypothetical protein
MKLGHAAAISTKCDVCSASFEDVYAKTDHRRSHDLNGMEDGAVAPGNVGATAPRMASGSTEAAREERVLAEGQQNDHTNALANREVLFDYRDDSEMEVNPDQTPKLARRVQPTEYV